MYSATSVFRRTVWLLFIGIGCVGFASLVRAAEVTPPKPAHYFNDYANKISPATASQLNSLLEDFERQTSSQIVVAVFPKMQSDSSLEDYAQRIYQAWGIGQKKGNNGALLLVFIADRKMRVQTGYGLEGALPDAMGKQIIEDVIKPYFQKNDFDGGLVAGVHAILAATKGEYKGTGRTVNQQGRRPKQNFPFVFAVVALFIFISLIRRARGVGYNSRGRRSFGFFPFPMGGGGGGGWSGGGGGFSSGGFSGGGGSSGGGGASGSW